MHGTMSICEVTIGMHMCSFIAIARAARVGACNFIDFETGQNLPLVLKIVTCTMHAA